MSWEIGGGLISSYLYGRALDDDFLLEIDYEDIFDTGTGGYLRGAAHFYRYQRYGRDFSVGPYAQFDSVTYEGDTDQYGPGFFLTPEDMTISKFLIGGHLRATFGLFFLGGQIGFGVAHIEEVRALDEDRVLGLRVRFDLFDQTYTFGTELAGRMGLRFPLGPRATMSVFLFGGFAYTGAPREGDLRAGIDVFPTGAAYGGLGISFDFGSVRSGYLPPEPYQPYDPYAPPGR
jgi:hypothetical protein